jgi:LuxR family transcriptional regulator
MACTLQNTLDDLYSGISLADALGVAQRHLKQSGFDVVTYDFSPVPLTHDGKFIMPTTYHVLNAPEDMLDLWCAQKYYAIDPVMDAAREVTQPFIWTYRGQQSAVMDKVLAKRHAPVTAYLQDVGMQCGISVPIHTANGALATFSAICLDPLNERDLDHHLALVGHMAHVLHDAVLSSFPRTAFQTPHVSLTPRERQCLRLCAAGLTSKEIAHELKRSVATVTLHLTSATKKLGARNRAQALALAAYYHLLDLDA